MNRQVANQASRGRSRSRRILAIHPVPDLYGADIMLVHSLQALHESGHSVVAVFSEKGPLLQRLDDIGIRHVVRPFPVIRRRLLRPHLLLGLVMGFIPATLRIAHFMRRMRPDVVYVNTLTLPHWVLAARLAGVPAVCHVHEAEESSPRIVRRLLTVPCLLTHRIIANSAATKKFLTGSWGALAPRTTVIFNGLDFPPETSRGARRGSRRRVCFVGRLSPRKGPDLAITAVAELVHQGHDVELELIGSAFRGYAWYEKDLHSLAHRLEVSDRVQFSGFRASVWGAYERADVVVVPSRIEPFGNVAVEALAMGAPLVVTAVGGLPEIVEHERTGLVVPPDDVDALVAALARLLDDAEHAADMGREGLKAVRERFGRERYAHDLVDAVALWSL